MAIMTFQQEYPLETCMFSVHQIHAEEILRLSVQTCSGHFAARNMSLQWGLTEHSIGVVIIKADITWQEEFTFLSATSLHIDHEMRLKADGKVAESRSRIFAGGRECVHSFFQIQPIRLSGGAAMDATPTVFEGAVRDMWQDTEVTTELPSRGVAREVSRLFAKGEVLGEVIETFKIRRSDCEFADQWKFIRLPSLLSAAREELAFSQSGELAMGLSHPMKNFRSEWWHPMFLGDIGHIHLRVVRYKGEVKYAYRVSTIEESSKKRRLCAFAIESY